MERKRLTHRGFANDRQKLHEELAIDLFSLLGRLSEVLVVLKEIQRSQRFLIECGRVHSDLFLKLLDFPHLSHSICLERDFNALGV